MPSLKAQVARKMKVARMVVPTRTAPDNVPPEAIAARTDFAAFVSYTMPEYEWNWHHRSICKHLEMLERGEIRRLMVFAPPRSGKTELVERRFVAWCLGRHPDWSIIGGSHTAGLAGEICQDVQDIIDSPEYAQVFPGTKLRQVGVKTKGGKQSKSRRTQRLFDVVSKKGVYRGVGTRTRLSGHGMELGILDDPIGDADEAFSPAYRQRDGTGTTQHSARASRRMRGSLSRPHAGTRTTSAVGSWTRPNRMPGPTSGPWYASQLLPKDRTNDIPTIHDRKGNPCGQLGRDSSTWKDSPPTRPAWVPSSSPPSCNNVPRLPKGRDSRRTGSSPGSGASVGYRLNQGLIPEFPKTPLSLGRFIPAAGTWRLTIVDPAATDGKGSDWTAIGTFVICPGGEILVLDMVRERLPLEKLVPRLKQVWEMYRPLYVGIEAVGFQEGVAKEARRLMPQAEIRGIHPQGKGKLVRAFPAIARAEAGKIYLPSPAPSWARAYLEEMTSFTGLGDLYDDMADVTCYAVLEAGELGSGRGLPMVTGKAREMR